VVTRFVNLAVSAILLWVCWAGATSPGATKVAGGQVRVLKKVGVLASADLASLPSDRRVIEIAFSRDGRRLITRSPNSIKVFDVEKEALVKEVANDKQRPYSFALSPDGKSLAIYTDFTILKDNVAVFDLTSGRRKFGLKHRTHEVLYSPDSRYLMTLGVCPDCSAKIWDAETGRQTAKLVVHTREKGDWPGWGDEPMVHGRFSPDGKMAVTVCSDPTAEVWSVPDGRPVSVLGAHVRRGDRSQVESDAAIFSPEGDRIFVREYVVAEGTRRISEWETRTGKLIRRAEAVNYLLSDAPPLLVSMCGNWRDGLTAWLMPTAAVRDLLIQSAQGHCSAQLRLSPRRQLLVQVSSQQKLVTIKVSGAESGSLRFELPPFEQAIPNWVRVEVSPDDALVAVARHEWVNLYDAVTGQLLHRTESGGSPVAFGPQGSLLAMSETDGNVSLWTVE
jgi:WD40 repeat protein